MKTIHLKKKHINNAIKLHKLSKHYDIFNYCPVFQALKDAKIPVCYVGRVYFNIGNYSSQISLPVKIQKITRLLPEKWSDIKETSFKINYPPK
jgi:hypothetical protein